MTDGISAITSSPLGAYGLNMNGAYSSYPGMMGMYGMGGYGTMGYNPAYGGMGIMGMYSPEYMMQLANVQNEMEMNQVRHAQSIDQLIADGSVNAAIHKNDLFMQGTLQDASIKSLMSGLISSINGEEKNLENFCHYFDALKAQIIRTHGDKILAKGSKENADLAATEIIEALYTTEVNAQYGRQNANLRDDLMATRENAFMNGYKCALRPGHSSLDLKHVMNHCFGEEITEREHDRTSRAMGGVAGRVAHGGKFAAQSAAVIGGGSILLNGAAKCITCIVPGGVEKVTAKDGKVTKKLVSLSSKIPFLKWSGFGLKLAAGVGAALGIIEIIAPGTMTKMLGIAPKTQQATA